MGCVLSEEAKFSHHCMNTQHSDEKDTCDLYMYVFSKKWQRTILFHYLDVIISTNDHIILYIL